MMNIGITQIGWYNDDDYKAFRQNVSNYKRSKIDKYRFREDYKRALLGDALAKKMIAQYTRIPVNELSIVIDEKGKPYVANMPEVHFNISHSGNWVVCGVSKEKCGIDVEIIDEDIDISIAEEFFTSYECDCLKKCEDSKRISLFYEFWTLKESYTKFIGEGLSMPLDCFEIMKYGDQYSVSSNTFMRCNIDLIDIDPQYKMAVSYLEEQYIVEYVTK